jgi:branched-chain amino acid transport system permease protein
MDLSIPCGKYHTNYREDMAVIRNKMQWRLLAGFAVLLCVLPLIIGKAWIGLINAIGISVIVVLGLNILTGYCGLISLGQSAFMGIGAYTCAVLAGKLGLPFWVTIPCAGLVSGLIGIIFGLPAVRIKGFYLVVASIAAQFVFDFTILHLLPRDFTGKETGLSVPTANLGPLSFDSETKIFYLIMGLVAVGIFFARNILRTRVGRAFIAIRDNDLAAQAMGVDLFLYKIIAFFICSVYAGVGGAIWAYYVRYIGIEQFNVWFSIWFVGMLIVGGLGTFMGSIFGVVFIKLLQELVTISGPFLNQIFPAIGPSIVFAGVNVLFGLVIVLFLIFEPKGIAHRWEIFKSYYRLFPFKYL